MPTTLGLRDHLEGPAVALHLTLWNRSGEVSPRGGTLESWRSGARVVWG